MKLTETELPGVLLIEPKLHRDDRGCFLETWREERYAEAGLSPHFVQDNVATSKRGVLRGLHYQYPEPQGKLVMVMHGQVLDVAVDVRLGSPTFGRWIAERLSAENGRQLWIPEGFAHGYAVLSETAVFFYKCTRSYRPGGEGSVRYDDPRIGVRWAIENPLLSSKDATAPVLDAIPPERLPVYEA